MQLLGSRDFLKLPVECNPGSNLSLLFFEKDKDTKEKKKVSDMFLICATLDIVQKLIVISVLLPVSYFLRAKS